MTEVVVSPRALRELEDIWLYVAVDNEAAADRLMAGVFDRIELLAAYPQMGAPRDDVRPGARHLVHGRYLVLYEFDEANDRVDVVAILDGARDLPNLI